MEPEDTGRFRDYDEHEHHCNNESDRKVTSPKLNSEFTFFTSTFTSVQMPFRKRKRGGEDGGDACTEKSYSRYPTRLWSSSTSPLVLTSLLLFLCLCPLNLVSSLPFDNRGSSLGGGGSQRSQMDLLIDPIHQAEFGDDEPLESKRVVAKSVFDMVLRTPPPPTSSSSRCPPGTQSPFEGGPCIKKSTDPVALVDQSFLLDTLRGLAKDGVIHSNGKNRKRRPGKPGGSRTTTTAMPPTSTSVITTIESTPPTPGEMTDSTGEMALSASNTQPVFEEVSTKLITETLEPSTLPTTIPQEEETTWNGIDRRRTPPSAINSHNEEQIATTASSKLPETTAETIIAEVDVITTTTSSLQQEKSGQDHAHVATTQSSASSKEKNDGGSEILPEIVGLNQDVDLSSFLESFTEKDPPIEDSIPVTDKDIMKIHAETPITDLPSHTTLIDDISPTGVVSFAPVEAEMTGVITSSESVDEPKEVVTPASPALLNQAELIENGMMKDEVTTEQDDYNEKIINEGLISTTLSSDGEEKINTSEPAPVTINDEDGLSLSALDIDFKPESPSEPIKAKGEVESKWEEEGKRVPETIIKEEQVEPLGSIHAIKVEEEQVAQAEKKIMTSDIMTSGKEEGKGAIQEHSGDRQPSSISSVVNHSTDSPSTKLVKDEESEEKGTVMMMGTTPPEKEIGGGSSSSDDDLLIINNPLISPNLNNYEVNKDGGIIGTTPLGIVEKDEAPGTSETSSSSREVSDFSGDNDALIQQQPQLVQDEKIEFPATTVLPSEPVQKLTSTSPFQQRNPTGSTLLQFQLPIVTTGPNHVKINNDGFQKFPEFPIPTTRIRFPTESINIDVPIEGGGSVKGTQRPVFIQDFQLDYPPLKREEQDHQEHEQKWQTPKPFLIPPKSASPLQTAQTLQPEYYDTGSTEYLESELDRRHQKTRSRNRVRTSETLSSTQTPLLELPFYSKNYSHPHRHQNQAGPPPSTQPSPTPPQQSFFFPRRTSELIPFAYLNYRPGHDRFHHNNRRLIW